MLADKVIHYNLDSLICTSNSLVSCQQGCDASERYDLVSVRLFVYILNLYDSVE